MNKVDIKNKSDLQVGRADNLPLAVYFAKYCLDRQTGAKNSLDLGCGYGELAGAFGELWGYKLMGLMFLWKP